MQSENIKSKVEELKRNFEQIDNDRNSLKAQIKDLQASLVSGSQSEKDLHAWQHAGEASGAKFTIMHALAVALVCLFFGRYLTLAH